MATALDILERYPLLRSLYFLRPDITGTSGQPTEAQAAFFLLWAAVHGRKEYHGLIVDRDYLDFLTAATGPYFSRLEFFAAFTANRTSTRMDDIHAWYYGHAVHDLKLEVFLTARELDVCQHWLTPRSAQPQPRSSQRFCAAPANLGVNLIGYANGVLGIGEDVRALANIARHARVPFAIINVQLSNIATTSEHKELADHFVDRPIFPISIFCTTAFETERLRAERGPNLFSNRYNIGCWPWELSRVPKYWKHVFDSVDEIWAISSFLAEVYAEQTNKPVIYIPPYVNVQDVEAFDRTELNLNSQDFIFLTMLDFNSHVMRKNPFGAIEAFKRAFPDFSGQERLIIKTINGDVYPKKLDELLACVNDDFRIVLMDGPLSRARICGLIRESDCFISLHRAEGFGRVIAEAMFLERPVIATDYSGSTTFLSELNGFPIPFTLRNVRAGEYIFEEESKWAEPDIDAAAEAFQDVRHRQSLVATRAAKAKKMIIENHGLEAVARKFVERLTAIAKQVEVRN